MLETENGLDLSEMANLYPATTGLPMTVWVSPRGYAQHDARVKANNAHGNRMDLHNAAVVGIRPTPRLIEGSLATADLNAVSNWIKLNEGALLEFWEGDIDTAQLIGRLQSV